MPIAFVDHHGEIMRFLVSRVEFLVVIAALFAGAIAGWMHARRIIKRVRDVRLETVHRFLGMGALVIGFLLGGVIALSVVGAVRPLAWRIALALELLHPFLVWGGLSGIFAYVGTLSLRVAYHERHRERRALAFAIPTLMVAISIFRLHATRPIAGELYDVTEDNEVVLQSSGVSCVPATVANILGRFGMRERERDLAWELGTTNTGTTYGRVALALWRRGLRCRRLRAANVDAVHAPAALAVDHPATGPESHMVALMAVDDTGVDVWDPLVGRRQMTRRELAAMWRGLALEVYRKDGLPERAGQ